MEKAHAQKIGNVLYINTPKNKFVPAYVYYLLEYFKCEGVCFGTSSKIYNKENLKGCDDWDEVKQNESK